ncbi:probable U3 small nucleolar RNA-associated protein 7 [Andrographis paniculata]|uniref:probable U3 small nucleolar RNA-associated protein 7 n=1 Tax=Andrographis paniculata TaxID=175694 RepID=UPI0021E99752|nr:probable U3 small nucleolar RNA-associated protein 7 [Andrographis paniculata]
MGAAKAKNEEEEELNGSRMVAVQSAASKDANPDSLGVSEEDEMQVKKYLRGEAANIGVLKDKKLKGQLVVREELYGKSAQAAAKAEKWLMPSEGGYLEAEGIEKTWRIKQEAIAAEVDILSSRKQYDIVLPDFGPYTLNFDTSGRYMVAGARKGHLALMDMKNMDLVKEFQVRETVRDVVFLHNQKFFAAAQKKYVYMYNDRGTELHCLKEHGAVRKLQFLNKHFLLTSINKQSQLHYQDITTGVMVGNYRTGLGRSEAMEVNPYNSVVAVGHSGGTVSMWKPTSAAPLVKMLCHQGPITAMAFHSNGHLMATAGMERKIKIWDLRKFEALQTLPGHAKALDFSQKGMLATATGSFVQILADLSGSQEYSRYMAHSMVKGYQINRASFRPYEDVLAIGHSMGWSSILIPGSGEPNFDTWVANPFETRKQRNEKEVRLLLDKLPPETIMLNPSEIGSVRPNRRKEKLSKEQKEAEVEAAMVAAKDVSFKKKTKGRSKPSKLAKKKQEAMVKAKKPFLEQEARDEDKLKKKKRRRSEETQLPKSLQRFAKKTAAS